MIENVTDQKKHFMQKTVVVWLGAMVCCLLWGSAFPCIKVGYSLFHIPAAAAASQILFAGCRFLLAGTLVLLIAHFAEGKAIWFQKEHIAYGIGETSACLKYSDIHRVLQLAAFQTVGQYVLFYMGLAHTTGVKSSIIEGANTFFVIILAAVLFHQEKIAANKILGCVLGFAGVVLINISGSSGFDFSFRWDGEFLLLVSCFASACSTCLIKKHSQHADPVLLSGW